MPEKLVEERWVKVPARVMDRRLDTLRQRANYLAQKIEHAPTGTRRHDEQEHAAIMWALAELSGIGDEVRRERAEMQDVKAGSAKRATARALAAEQLNEQFRLKIAALKDEIYRLRQAIYHADAVRSAALREPTQEQP